jgi:hypothetical protein
VVKYAGMLCIVRGFRKAKTWIKLMAPNDQIVEVPKRELQRKEKARLAAITSFKAAVKGITETPDYLLNLNGRTSFRGGI